MLSACLIAQVAYIFAGDFTIYEKIDFSDWQYCHEEKSRVIQWVMLKKKSRWLPSFYGHSELSYVTKQAEFLDNFSPKQEDEKNKNRPKQREVAIRLFFLKNNNFW